MSNPTSIHSVTQPIVQTLAQVNEVIAIICMGSYAFGTADAYSDIDLYVICDPHIISPSTRQSVLEQTGTVSSLQIQHELAGWDNQWAPQTDQLKLRQQPIDISYNTKMWLTTVVNKVITQGAISIPELTFRPYTMLGLLANAISLYDSEDFIKNIIAQLYPYPQKLKQNILAEFMPQLEDSLTELQNFVLRDIDNAAFLFHLSRFCDALTSILYAINEVYDPAVKRSMLTLSKLDRMPTNFLACYEAILVGPFDRPGRQSVIETLAEMVDEIKGLRH